MDKIITLYIIIALLIALSTYLLIMVTHWRNEWFESGQKYLELYEEYKSNVDMRKQLTDMFEKVVKENTRLTDLLNTLDK